MLTTLYENEQIIITINTGRSKFLYKKSTSKLVEESKLATSICSCLTQFHHVEEFIVCPLGKG